MLIITSQVLLSLAAIKRIAEHHLQNDPDSYASESEAWDLQQRANQLCQALRSFEEQRTALQENNSILQDAQNASQNDE